MKKLTLLIMLAVLVTVGGVYASWNYAEVATSVKTNTETSLSVTDPITNTARGLIDVNNTLALVIDDNNGDYIPEWDDMVNDDNGGTAVITFTPNAGIDPGADGKIILRYEFSIDGNTYTANSTDYALFNYTVPEGAEANVFLRVDVECAKDSATTVTVKYSDIIAALTPNNEFTVPTFTDYENYVDAIDAASITLTVTEIVD